MTNVTNDATGENSTFKDTVKQATTTASSELKSHAQDVAETVRSEASGYAERAKTAAAGEVKSVASALRTAAHEMRSGSAQERTFSQIADGLADASDAMRDKDLGEIVRSINDFAKRNPLVFLGSAALISFAATRFAKASGETTGQSSVAGTPSSYRKPMDRPSENDPSRLAGTSQRQTPATYNSPTGSLK